MDVVTYVKERRRICHEHSVCAECPLRKFDDCYDADPEELVKAVKEWSDDFEEFLRLGKEAFDAKKEEE
jgi:hypothetical protein